VRAQRHPTISISLHRSGVLSELKYLVNLSDELGYVGREWNDIQQRCEAVVKQLERLTQKMETEAAAERARKGNLACSP
jgi:hypothetical protein